MEDDEEQNLTVYHFRGTDGESVPRDGYSGTRDGLHLQKVIVDKSVKALPDRFMGSADSDMDDYIYYRNLQEVVLHDELGSIGAEAFSVTGLREIKIFSSTEKIGRFAFSDCGQLTKVEFIPPPLLSSSSPQQGLKVIGDDAFLSCTILMKISIPPTVEKIGDNAFEKSGLVEVDLSGLHLKVLQESVFMYCSSLQAVRLPNTIERICNEAFWDCDNLVTLEIPQLKKALEIEGDAFCGCKCLMNVKLETIHQENHPNFYDCALLCERFAEIEIDAHDMEVISRISNGTNLSSDEVTRNFRVCKGLLKRFLMHPVHKLCYHASTSTTIEEFTEAIIEQQEQQSQKIMLTSALDEFNMTPFHVLCSSVAPRKDMLEALLAVYPPHILGWKDANGKRAMDYLVHNWSPELLGIMFESWAVCRLRRWGGGGGGDYNNNRMDDISRRLGDLLESQQDPWERHYIHLHSTFKTREETCTALCERFEIYEVLESISVLEMSLWRKEIATRNADRSKKVARDREQCLNQCGSSVVVPSVALFLGLELLEASNSANRVWKQG